MSRYQFVRISFVPKEREHRWSNKITPVDDQQQDRNSYFNSIGSSLDSDLKDTNEKDSENNRRRRRLNAWLIIIGIACTLIAFAAMIISIYLLVRTNKTPTIATSVSILNNNAAIVSNTTTITIISTSNTLGISSIRASTNTSTSNTLATSSASASTNTSTTTNTTTTTATTNICIGNHTYANQLLYLNLSSILSWTQYVFNYTSPNVNTATLMFALRNDPGFWYLDDVLVANSSGQQLLSNGGFEQGNLVNWVYCNPQNATYAGAVISVAPNSGSYCYSDGSVGAADYLSQTFNVEPNTMYTVSFWLSANSNSVTFAWITVYS